MTAGPSSRSTFFFSDVQFNSEHRESCFDRTRQKFWRIPSDYLTTMAVQQQPYLNLLPFLNFPRPLLRIPYVIYS